MGNTANMVLSALANKPFDQQKQMVQQMALSAKDKFSEQMQMIRENQREKEADQRQQRSDR